MYVDVATSSGRCGLLPYRASSAVLFSDPAPLLVEKLSMGTPTSEYDRVKVSGVLKLDFSTSNNHPHYVHLRIKSFHNSSHVRRSGHRVTRQLLSISNFGTSPKLKAVKTNSTKLVCIVPSIPMDILLTIADPTRARDLQHRKFFRRADKATHN